MGHLVWEFARGSGCPRVERLNDHCLKSLSKKFKEDVSDDRGYRRNFKIGSGKDISDCPSHTLLLTHARALKFSHQQIGIKQKDDKTNFNDSSPNTFLHSKY